MDTAKTIIKSYKFRIYPTRAQVKTLETTLGLCRELYNAALQERREAYDLNRVSISYFDQQNQLPEIKIIREDLKAIHSHVLCDVLKRADKTYQAYFARLKRNEKVGKPRIKGQNSYHSFCYPQVNNSSVNILGNKLNLPKIGKIKIKLSRAIIGKAKTCTIKREIDKWFATFSLETTVETLPKTRKEIGIDVGIESFATLSDGRRIENFKFYQSTQKNLRVANRRVSRRKKFSSGWKKAKKQVAKIHLKIRNQRNDFQQKLSTKLIEEFDLIAIEKLNVKGLSKGILSKQINDVAWGNFFRILRYKAENAGRKLIEVNPRGTSQTCLCGETVKKDLSVRWHECDKCGLSEHRDIVSAKIILRLGRTAEMPSSVKR